MKTTLLHHGRRQVPALLSLLLLAGLAAAADSSFQDFRNRDQQAYRDFLDGKKQKAPAQAARAVHVRADPHPDRAEALRIYNRYCELRGQLESGDTETGIHARIRALESELWPTCRLCDMLFWPNLPWNEPRWVLLRKLREQIPAMRKEMEDLDRQWTQAGFYSRIFPLPDCYGKNAWHMIKDETTFPVSWHSNLVDYVGERVEKLWPLNPDTPSDPPKPPPTPPIDTSTNGVPPQKTWDEMSPEERHEALARNNPEPWFEVYRILKEGTAAAIEQVKTALAASGAASSPFIAVTNLAHSTQTAEKPWRDMTDSERHEALKKPDPGAWDCVREALLSRDPAQVELVIRALGARRQRPVLTALTPAVVPPGGTLTLAGSGLGERPAQGKVDFEGAAVSAAAASVWVAERVTLQVPAQARSGKVLVFNGEEASNGLDLTIATPLQVKIASAFDGGNLTRLTLQVSGGEAPYQIKWKLEIQGQGTQEGTGPVVNTQIPYTQPDDSPGGVFVRPGPPALLSYRVTDKNGQVADDMENVGQSPWPFE